MNNIPHNSWARYSFPFPRFGHDTNITESINHLLGDIRKLPPLQMMDALYTLCMKKVHDRFHRKQRSTVIADVPLSKFNDRLQSSRRYQVFESGNGIYKVQILDTNVKYIVNLQERRCDCSNFSEYESPCTHAIVAC